MKLHELLATRREALLESWAARVKSALMADVSHVELMDRMPRFLGELVCALAPEVAPLPDAGSPSALEHGVQRLRLGFDIGEVVREYGLLHVTILDLAEQARVQITEAEAKVLATCLNTGTADAVTQYQWQRDSEVQRQASEHLGFIARTSCATCWPAR